MVFSYEQEEQLIELYQENPNLWNTKDVNFKNKQMKQTKLNEISIMMGGIDVKEISEKFRNLRITFMREYRKSVNKRSGDSGDVFVSKWKHYQKMFFIRDTIVADESHSNMTNNSTSYPLDVDSNEDNEYSITSLDSLSPASTASPLSESTSRSPYTSSVQKRKRHSQEKSELIKVAAKMMSIPEEKDDEEMLFCRSLAASLRQFERPQKEAVKLELQQVIVRHINPNYYNFNQ